MIARFLMKSKENQSWVIPNLKSSRWAQTRCRSASHLLSRADKQIATLLRIFGKHTGRVHRVYIMKAVSVQKLRFNCSRYSEVIGADSGGDSEETVAMHLRRSQCQRIGCCDMPTEWVLVFSHLMTRKSHLS